jgi:hypothetical protein
MLNPKPLEEIRYSEVIEAIGLSDYSDEPELVEKRRKVAEMLGRKEQDIIKVYNADNYG